MKNLFITALCLATAASSLAAELEYTYNVNNDDPLVYGFNKKETYDVAILLNDPSLVGAKVTGMKVLLPVDASSVDNLSSWMTSELTLDGKNNAPDICSVEASYSEYYLSATFPEPYTVTSDGVYVGYSFDITDLEDKEDYPDTPVAVVKSDMSGGLFVHSSRTRKKWADIGADIEAVSMMVVTLEADYKDYDAAATLPANSYLPLGEELPVAVKIVNHGQNPIQEIGYSYTIGEYAGNGSFKLEEPINSIGDIAVVKIPMKTEAEIGTYPFIFTLETVNGQANTDPNRVSTGELSVIPFIPVNRPLVEEYTGLNCGYCPRGYIAMEEMNRMNGDLFIGMAYHSDSYESRNAMVVLEYDDFPYAVTGYPFGTINRMAGMNPSEFPFVWDNYRNDMPVADLEISTEWTDETMSELRATTNVRFIKDFEQHNYKLAIALVADNLFNSSWAQSNYFSGKEPEGVESELWDLFINGYAKVPGLVFNDVVVYYKDVKGIDGALPESITVGENITYEYSVRMDDVVNLGGTQFMNPEAKLHFVAMVLDGNTGYAINSNKSSNVNYTTVGINGIESNAEVIETIYHDLQGRRMEEPSTGIFIKKEILSDGTTRVSKVIVR